MAQERRDRSPTVAAHSGRLLETWCLVLVLEGLVRQTWQNNKQSCVLSGIQ
jgi:hypothetical protein